MKGKWLLLPLVVLISACGGSSGGGAAFLESCVDAGDCASGLACMGGICLHDDACSNLGCDWNTEVCVTDRQGNVGCVPSCIDRPTACADIDPELMNSHPVVGYWRAPGTGEVRPFAVCACLDYGCPSCPDGQMCMANANDDSPERQNVQNAIFPSDFVSGGGTCYPRP